MAKTEGLPGQPGRVQRVRLVALVLAIACVALFQLGRFIGERAGVQHDWPIPEEMTRNGEGRLTDVVPGEWEVICYAPPFGPVAREVRAGLAAASLPAVYGENLPDVDLSQHQSALALLSREEPPRILILRKTRRFDFHLEGPGCVRRAKARYKVKMFEMVRTRIPHAVITMDSGETW